MSALTHLLLANNPLLSSEIPKFSEHVEVVYSRTGMINNTTPDNPTTNRPNTIATSFLVGIVIQLVV